MCFFFRASMVVGSSPLTRGKLNRRDKPLATAGLIPAHAGKTRRFRSRLATLPGSSPLTRGKLVHGLLNGDRGRLIPAHAGKTSGRITVCHAFPAHPRSRGENVLMSLGLWARSGSSPLTRGKLRSLTRSSLTGRLIPAHAGKTAVIDTLIADRAAHPRSRGENRLLLPQRPVERGSSPLTRGKRGPLPRPLGRVRLIPAHAGKTVKFGYTNRDGSAHPRSRGENGLGVGRLRCGCGSSPLTRGKPLNLQGTPKKPGLIPAHAGKTTGGVRAHHAPRAHPRSRGENQRIRGH